jgi:hypothetical protein
MSVSPSQLDAMDCRLKWYWTYNQGWRSRHVEKALSLGTGVHIGLEAYYGHKKDPVAAFQKWCDAEIKALDPRWADDLAQMQEIRRLGTAMLEGYVATYKGRDPFDVIATEHTVQRVLPDPRTGEPSPYHVTVRLDGVIRLHDNGRLASLEHKTFSRIEPAHFPRDRQFTMQVWCGQALAETLGLDEEIIGVYYNGLRSAEKGPRTTAPLYERHFIERLPHQIDVAIHAAFWAKWTYDQANIPIYPEPQAFKCGRCGVSEVCLAYMKGEDWQQLLDEHYVRRGDSRTSTAAERKQIDSIISEVQPTDAETQVVEAAVAGKRSLRDRMR